MTSYTCTSLGELAVIADDLLQTAHGLSVVGATVITLTGDLGAGKTALTKIIASKLGVEDVVTSPTFVVMKQYETTDVRWPALIHIDAYRIETKEELAPLRITELLEDPHNLIVIEWPNQMASIIPKAHLAVTLEVSKEDIRTITIHPHHG